MEWFWNLECSFTIRLIRPLILPMTWRDEGRRIRQEAMKVEYPLLGQLSHELRMGRLLDDAFQEFWTVVPPTMHATLHAMTLSQLSGQQLHDTIDIVEKDMKTVWTTLNGIKRSAAWSPLFETTEVPLDAYSGLHSKCCPPPPFRSLLKYAYPLAAGLDLFILSTRRFIHRQVFAPLQKMGHRVEWFEAELKTVGAFDIAYEMSRIFAAIEEDYQGHPGALMPHFRPFNTVGSACEGEHSRWYWHKLAHFDELGSAFVEPSKRQLAIFWGIPELATIGFSVMKTTMQIVETDSAVLRAANKALEEPPDRPPDIARDDLNLDECV
jgi:hypothetical protein